MQELQHGLTSIGLAQVETFIASGNVVFEADDADLAGRETQIESALAAEIGFAAEIFLRSREELSALVAAAEAARLPSTISLNVGLLKQPVDADLETSLSVWQGDIDQFTFQDRAFIWTSSMKISQSPFGLKGYQARNLPVLTMRTVNTFARMLDKW